MARVIRFFPFFPVFTLFGLLTIGLFLLQGAMGPEFENTAFGQILVSVLRVIIIPLYLMTLLVVMVGGVLFGFGDGSFPIWYNILTIPVRLVPYVLADILFAKWMRS